MGLFWVFSQKGSKRCISNIPSVIWTIIFAGLSFPGYSMPPRLTHKKTRIFFAPVKIGPSTFAWWTKARPPRSSLKQYHGISHCFFQIDSGKWWESSPISVFSWKCYWAFHIFRAQFFFWALFAFTAGRPARHFRARSGADQLPLVGYWDWI